MHDARCRSTGLFTVKRQDAPVSTIITREARESASLFKNLSDPIRLTILGLLAAEGEMFVGQLC
jgi:hypothetical protein